MKQIAAVVLAAGSSERLGSPKQLEVWGGETLLRRTARIAAAVGCSPVQVVLGFEAERMRAELTGLRVRSIQVQDWRAGMGRTLAAGTAALLEDARPEGLLLLVCDQLNLDEGVLRRLLAAFSTEPNRIWASTYDGVRGVPAVFPPAAFPALCQLSGDQGARQLLRASGAAVGEVPWPEGGRDLDRPEDRPKRA